eukprot:TRINITY_DN9062_c0_g1_i2.p1 TRINITY_DN9062_c0_g1~~TRINITY_DN9062_c0_g1_i2.p1  ORF type:complete len:451 (+),score=90.63 TRINITY_DN9062_c0_g1_i2:190-1542(+)
MFQTLAHDFADGCSNHLIATSNISYVNTYLSVPNQRFTRSATHEQTLELARRVAIFISPHVDNPGTTEMRDRSSLSVFAKLYSYFLSLLDVVGSFLSSYRRFRDPRRRFFNKGFGDLDVLAKVEGLFREHGSDGFDDIEEIDWEAAVVKNGLRLQRGSCRSPLHDYFRGNNKTMHVVHVSDPAYRLPSEPEDGRPLIKGMVVHLAATGDMGAGFRTKAMAAPIAKQGYASMVLIVAFYGLRRPEDQVVHYVDNVSDYILSSAGCYVEAAKLVQYHRNKYPSVPLGVTGMSYGGAMASIVATLLDKEDLVLVSCVGSASPRVLLSGVLVHDINTEALAKDADMSQEEAFAKLKGILEAIDLQHELDQAKHGLRPDDRYLVTRCISACHDHYVIPDEGQLLYDITAARSKDAQLHWFLGGHGTGMFNAPKHFAPHIPQAFERLAQLVAQRDD